MTREVETGNTEQGRSGNGGEGTHMEAETEAEVSREQ